MIGNRPGKSPAIPLPFPVTTPVEALSHLISPVSPLVGPKSLIEVRGGDAYPGRPYLLHLDIRGHAEALRRALRINAALRAADMAVGRSEIAPRHRYPPACCRPVRAPTLRRSLMAREPPTVGMPPCPCRYRGCRRRAICAGARRRRRPRPRIARPPGRAAALAAAGLPEGFWNRMRDSTSSCGRLGSR